MTRRERLLAALRSGEPDRPPVHILNATPSALATMDKSWRSLSAPRPGFTAPS